MVLFQCKIMGNVDSSMFNYSKFLQHAQRSIQFFYNIKNRIKN